jgi:predicted DNA-binding protein
MNEQTCDSDADVHLSVRLPAHQKDELARRAQAEDRSLSYYVKRLISDHLAVPS